MELASLFFLGIVFTFIGANVLYLISGWRALAFLECIAISFGLGVGCVTLEILFFHILNLQLNALAVILPWLVLIAVNAILYFGAKVKAGLLRFETKKFGYLDIALSLGIAFEISYAFFRALIKPIESYDAVAIYAIKSKIFFLARGIPHDFFTRIVNYFPHPDYPLNIPLAEMLGYLFMGNLNDQLVKLIFPIFFICILALLYFAVRRFASRTYALVFTFILATIPQFNAYAANAYLELPFAFYAFAAALFLFRWFEDRKLVRFLLISAIMAGLAGWTKNEGLMYCAAYIMLAAIFLILNFRKVSRKDIACFFLYIVVIAAILAPWLYIKNATHLINTDIGRAESKILTIGKEVHKLKPILNEFQKQVFGPKKWNIFWIALIASIAFNIKDAFRGTGRYAAIFLALVIGGYVFIYMAAPIDVTFFVKKSWSRFLLHFLPIAVYWLALMLKDDVKI